MRVGKIMVTMALLAGLLNGFNFAHAADSTATAADLDKLQEQFRVLDKDVALLKEISALKLDAQEKRISDIGLATAQHANHLSAISNQTTSVGNYIAWTSGVITLLVLAAGFITYFSATRRVKEESREWFEKNASALRNEIQALRKNAKAASGEIDGHKEQVATSSKAALHHVQTKRNEVDAAASKILQPKQPEDGRRTAAIDPESAAVVTRASDELKAKPELSFTAEDHFARGLSHFANENHLSALESFKAALQALPEPAGPYQLARYLFAKAVVLDALGKANDAIAAFDAIDNLLGNAESPDLRELVARGLLGKGYVFGKLGKWGKAIAVFETIDSRFGNDDTPSVHGLVGSARNGVAFWQIMTAKEHWRDTIRKKELLATAIKGLERALLLCHDDDERPMMLGNLGYALFLLGSRAAGAESIRECLKLGGEKLLAAQRGDAHEHRVEPEDSEYEALLTSVWADLHPAKELAASNF
jgi:tetratricopeptide (TPR) repeat protein